MLHRSLSAFSALVLALSLVACGGGGSSSGGGGGGGGVIPPGSTITLAPSSLSFSGPGAAPQSFTVSSSLGAVPSPAINLLGCGSVASLSGPSSATLPATYTVSAQGNGSCSLVVSLNHQSSALGITVGGASSPTLGPISPVTVFVGGTPATVSVTAPSGTLIPDASSCSGIAAVGATGGGSSATFTIAGIAPGTCTLVVADGASTTSATITVNPGGGPNAVTITPSTLTFSSPSAGPQQSTLNFTGNVGQVTINEDDCIGLTGKPKIAFATVPTGPLPQNVTVTLYGTAGSSGTSCTMSFTSSVGATQAVLTIFVK